MMNATQDRRLTSRNEARGFRGAIRRHATPDDAWPLAMQAIAGATGCPDDAVRAFLDSRHGGSFAHQVVGALAGRLELPAAIDHAVHLWMTMRTDARLHDEVGIPEGLPYLKGFVMMHQARREMAGTGIGLGNAWTSICTVRLCGAEAG